MAHPDSDGTLANNSILVKLSICGKMRATTIGPSRPRGSIVIGSCIDKDLDKLARAFKALSNPNRLAIYLEVLRQYQAEVKSCGLSHLIDRLDIGAPTVSHHTKELVDAGLISVQREGRFLRCTLDEGMRQRLAVFFNRGESGSPGATKE